MKRPQKLRKSAKATKGRYESISRWIIILNRVLFSLGDRLLAFSPVSALGFLVAPGHLNSPGHLWHLAPGKVYNLYLGKDKVII